MRAIALRPAAFPVLAGSILLTAAAAFGEERLVMPYECWILDGRVTLSPSHEQSYRIIGSRESRPFTACSPANPRACRTWEVHRFDMDCGGTRVSWPSVVAASERGDAWIEDGRFHLRMGRHWARPQRGIRGWFSSDQRRRYRSPEFEDDFSGPDGYSRRREVVMPQGFAPALSIPADFVTATAEAPADIAPAAPPPLPTPKTADKPSSPPSTQPATAKDVAAKPQPAHPDATDIAVKEQPAPQPRKEAPAPLAKMESPAPAAAEPAVGTSITPTIINRPDAASAKEPTPKRSEEAASTVAAAKPKAAEKTAPADAAAPVPPPSNPGTTEVAQLGEMRESQNSQIETGGLAAAQAFQLPALQVIGGLAAALLLLTAVVLLRRRERVHSDALATRDFASVALPGAGSAVSTVPVRNGAASSPSSAADLPSREAAPSKIPKTTAEALQFLGVSPDADEKVIKKIVDGLRQSWHPDQAKDEADRQIRERRLKEINIAWDLVCGSRRHD